MKGQPLRFERAFKEQIVLGSPLSLLQDQQGFLWIGTTDGLYRYDGKKTVSFHKDLKDSLSISNDFVRTMIEDKEGYLWIGTKEGLNRYDPKTNQFQRFLRESDNKEEENYILGISEDRSGFIWYGTYNGLFRLNPKTSELLQFLPDSEKANATLSSKIVWSILEDSQGILWVATHKGINYCQNNEALAFKSWLPNSININEKEIPRTWSLAEDNKGVIWVGTDKGLYGLTMKGQEIDYTHLQHDPQNKNSLSSNYILHLNIDKENKIWVATGYGGLNLISNAGQPNEQIVRYMQEKDNPQSLRFNQLKMSLIDWSGILWVATNNGLDKAVSSNWKFKIISARKAERKGLSHGIIKSILKDKQENLWVGTLDGLNVLSKTNFESQQFDFQVFNYKEGLANSNIGGLLEDSQGYLWISNHQGLNYANIESFQAGQSLSFKGLKGNFPQIRILSIAEIQPNQYWVNTVGDLIKMEFNPKDNIGATYTFFEPDPENENTIINNYVYQAVQDRLGDYWFATFNGLSKYQEKNGIPYFENFLHVEKDSTSLSNNTIITVFKDSKERIWVGTRAGLNLVQQANRNAATTFQTFGRANGFPNQVIQSILEGNQSNLWIGTNKGLVKFNPEKALNGEKGVENVYYKSDGLSNDAFVYRAAFKDENGTLFFGTSGGLIYFNPNNLNLNQHIPRVQLTDFKLFNQSVNPNPKGLLKKAIQFTEEITLRHNENVFSIEFAALDFSSPEQNKYQYQLKDFDKNWINADNQTSATYTNLDAGIYTFLVKGTNNDGVWSPINANLKIRVLPPPWATYWAFALYFFIITGLLYAFVRYRIQLKSNELEKRMAVQTARFEERENMRKQNAADFHDELGHRLTKISLFLELAERQLAKGESALEYLKRIKQNAGELSTGFRDLIWTLDPQKDTLYQTMVRLQEFGDQLFEDTAIRFQLEGLSSKADQIQLAPIVRKQILKIFKEAMHNALKYSNGESAVLTLNYKQELFEICFKDNGIGFQKPIISNGYGLKNMKNRAKKIEAELKIESVKEKGIKITLSKIPHLG